MITLELPPLFRKQYELDDRIVQELGIEHRAVINERILALQVEVGELANEWRGFKFWSKNQEPRESEICKLCENAGYITALTHSGADSYHVDVVCPACEGVPSSKNPMLEEFVDCLHFILSIGNTIGVQNVTFRKTYVDNAEIYATRAFSDVFKHIARLSTAIDENVDKSEIHTIYEGLFNQFLILGESHLGYDQEQIVNAYYDKNKINHVRQDTGY